ncbi:MAG TPA: ADOP family duplicated permease [Gemmatimonadaceae bacterium]|nr:ADOP family duplicated permease [Gemmatimonadaceae bacterium]
MLLRLRGWLRALLRHGAVEREMREEMQYHLDRATERLVARGLSRVAARVAARREFGNVAYLQEEARDARGIRWLAELEQDLRIALRRLRRAPTLAVAIALTIGLGLGAAATIVAAAEAAFITPLPYVHADRLVHLWEVRIGSDDRGPTSYPTLADWRARLRSFSALEGYDPANLIVGSGTEAQMRRGAEVTPGFFRLLGVQPAAGRDFSTDDVVMSSGPVAIVSARLARSAGTFSLGHSIPINGRAYMVVGVLPDDFRFALLQDADVFVPLVRDARRRADRFDRSIHIIGRLAAHVPLATARTELAAVMSQLATEYPDALAGRTAVAVPLRDALLGNVRPILTSLLLAVALVLVTMGANLALLMLARYAQRVPELHMRTVLGATRARILRQLFVESIVPGTVGAALAIVLGQAGMHLLLGAIPGAVRISMPYFAHAGIDAKVVIVLAILTIALVMVFGVLPGVFTMRGRPLTAHARTTLSRSDRRLRQGLVAIQLALTVVLLVCTGLLVTSFTKLLHRDLGFRDPAGLVAARAPLTGPRYESALVQRQFYEALLRRSMALPGVRTAGLVNEVPGGGGGMTTFDPVDHPRRVSVQPRALVRIVGGAYFATMGIPVVRGRVFGSNDRADSPPVVIVSRSLARLLARDGPVIGRRLHLAAGGARAWVVVGIVGDVQATALDAASPPVIYTSHRQMAENRMTLVLRTELSVEAVRKQLRSIVESMDAGVPVYAVMRLDQQLDESRAVFSRKFPMILCSVFGVAALALTLVALYAICAHEVTIRRREFGIRMALGATPRLIHALIFTNGLRLGLAGVGGGVVIALVATRAIHALLFGVAAADWAVYALVAAVVLVSSALATIGPALRARMTNPSLIMRQE